MTVVSCSLRRPRWKGEVNSACEVETSALLRLCTVAAEERRAGSCCCGCRAVWRTKAVAALVGRDIVVGVGEVNGWRWGVEVFFLRSDGGEALIRRTVIGWGVDLR